MPSLRRLLLLASVLFATCLGAALQAQTITYTNGETNTDLLSDGTYDLVINSGSATHSGLITGTGRIEKLGAGTLVLSGTNTYDEATRITEGGLTGTNNSAFGIGSITLLGGSLYLTGNSTISNVLIVNAAGTIGGTGSGQVNTYSGAISLNTSGGSLTLDATGTGRAQFSGLISGSGNLVITGNNDGLAGTTSSRVMMDYVGNQTFTGNLTINSGGLLQLASDLSTATVTVDGSLWLTGDLGTSRTVNIGALSGSGTVRVILNANQIATLQVGSNNATTSFSGVIAGAFDAGSGNGAIGLTKVGAGTLSLTGANTYSGGTTVSAGTLLANNTSGSATGTGNVTVNSGATLGGSGFISGLTTFNSGAILAPGSSLGTLTFSGGLTLNTGSILDFQLGTTSDLIRVTGGTLTGPSGTGGVTLNFSNSGGFGAGTYTLINYTTASGTSDFQATDFTLGTTIPGYIYNLALSGNTLQLTASAIPEPSTYAAIFGALVLGLAVYRKRRRA